MIGPATHDPALDVFNLDPPVSMAARFPGVVAAGETWVPWLVGGVVVLAAVAGVVFLVVSWVRLCTARDLADWDRFSAALRGEPVAADEVGHELVRPAVP